MNSRINPFFERKRFRKEQLFSKRTFLAQVLSLERLISVLRCEGCLTKKQQKERDFIIRSCNSKDTYITQHLYKKQGKS